jgi:hypothetical protein
LLCVDLTFGNAFSVYAKLRLLLTSLYCKYIHYMFRRKWASSGVQIDLTRQQLLQRILFRLLLCCGHAHAKFYGLLSNLSLLPVGGQLR